VSAASWLSVTVWPAIVRVADRAPPPFASTANVTVPEPTPVVGLVILTNAAAAARTPGTARAPGHRERHRAGPAVTAERAARVAAERERACRRLLGNRDGDAGDYHLSLSLSADVLGGVQRHIGGE